MSAGQQLQRGKPMPTWDGPEYVRVSPGRYDATATRIQGPDWVRRFRRWSLIVEFELLSEGKRVCAFFNMGTNPERPHAGQQSRYFKAWAMANGELPRAKQKLDPEVFRDGQVYTVEVSDSGKDSGGLRKADALVYSQVTEILSVAYRNQQNHPIGQSAQSPDSSFNQESGIMQSRNQESPNQGGQGRGARRRGHGASPKPGVGNAHAKQTKRAGASAPAQANPSQQSRLQ
jgi:hypothetical protein